MSYSEKVLDHYEHPRNVGAFDKEEDGIGTGMVGAPACGDVMRLQIRVRDDGVIEDARFKTYGCGSAIASSSLVTEWLKGKTLDQAQTIKNSEIAEELGLHESTISRVTTQKFMATPRGIFELKYFFGSHVSTVAGGECSATAIRALIRQLVSAEDTKRPLSDARIAEILGQQGIVVARRTIAKYREALNIPPVNLRKSI